MEKKTIAVEATTKSLIYRLKAYFLYEKGQSKTVDQIISELANDKLAQIAVSDPVLKEAEKEEKK